MSAQADQQVALTCSRERTFYAAAHKHFKILRCKPHKNPPCCINAPDVPTFCSIRLSDVDVTSEEVTIEDIVALNVEYGDWLVVDWHDPRPDGEVWDPSAPKSGRSAPFAFWDGPSLALEMHVNAMGVQDTEKRKFFGNWLYISTDEACPHFFWSMIFHYHATGRCFPVIPEKFQPKINPKDKRSKEEQMATADSSCALYNKEMMRILSVMRTASSSGVRGGQITLASEMESVSASVQGIMQSGNATKIGVPNPPTMVGSFVHLPQWVEVQEKLWGGLLKRYCEGNSSNAPCMWISKVGRGLVGCLAGPKCHAEHDPVTKAIKAVNQLLKRPRSEQDKSLGESVQTSERMVQNAVKCCNPDCEIVKTQEDMSRCSRCKNTAYCGVDCQKAHWKAHKPNCRAPGNTAEAKSSWAVVFPADESVRPYAVLLDSKDWKNDVQVLLDTDNIMVRAVARGDNINGVCMLTAVEGEQTSPRQYLDRPANNRACAIVTPLTSTNTAGKFRADGLHAPVRGDSIAFRLKDPAAAGGSSPPELCDFGYQDYNTRWGIFMTLMMKSESKSDFEDGDWRTSALLPNTPEGNEMMMKIVNHGNVPGMKK